MGMLHLQYSFIVLIPYGNSYKTLHFFSNFKGIIVQRVFPGKRFFIIEVLISL